MEKQVYQTAIYLRLSRDDEKDGESYSISNQRQMLTDFVNEKEDLTLSAEFVDDGYSGYDFSRPQFQKMMDCAKNGEINCIVNGSQLPMLIDERFVEPIAIAWEEAMNFLYQGRITKDDFPRRDLSFDAEGNIIEKEIVIFKEMQIGEQRMKNVEVVVVKNLDYKFVINRNGLRQFGNYEFDKQQAKLIFYDE